MHASSLQSAVDHELLLRAVRRVDVAEVARRLTAVLRADEGYGAFVRPGAEALRVNRWNIEQRAVLEAQTAGADSFDVHDDPGGPVRENGAMGRSA